jgi:Aminotransferase class-III
MKCGFKRTGKMFGHMHVGIKPDMITMAKGIKRVLTITAVRKDIYKVFKQQQEFSFSPCESIWRKPGSMCSCAKKYGDYRGRKLIRAGSFIWRKTARSYKYCMTIHMFGIYENWVY